MVRKFHPTQRTASWMPVPNPQQQEEQQEKQEEGEQEEQQEEKQEEEEQEEEKEVEMHEQEEEKEEQEGEEQEAKKEEQHEESLRAELHCPGCNRFIAEPVTVACGHSYCMICLQQTFVSTCKRCDEELGAKHLLRVNVLLRALLHKWSPQEVQKNQKLTEVKELMRSKHFTTAVSLSTQLLQAVRTPESVCDDDDEDDRVHLMVQRDLLDPTDFECSLCMRLFYEPVTTPCGHSFCKNCLQRSLDHSPQCPLCKESLRLYLASRKLSVTRVLDDIIKCYLSDEHTERQKIHNDETKEFSDLENTVPIFVCTMAYPTVPCPLHIFEPRYRLMVRRCIETGTRQFGMCISDAQKGFADFGSILHIVNVHFLPDGRSVVDTVGGKRFRVSRRSMRDGYYIANIEYLQDQRVEGNEELQLQDLYDQVYNQASVWFHTLDNRFRNQILQHFGPMPKKENDIQSSPNGPACCWWLLAVLPVDPRYQLLVLSMTTLRERLVKIQHILACLQNTHPE